MAIVIGFFIANMENNTRKSVDKPCGVYWVLLTTQTIAERK